MTASTYKILIFLKRRPGMTVKEFRDYYENIHAPLCLKYVSGPKRYFRRFLDPLPDVATGKVEEMPFDVITELWFDDEEIFRRTVHHFSTSLPPDEIVQDEFKLFDRQKMRIATVIECSSNLVA